MFSRLPKSLADNLNQLINTDKLASYQFLKSLYLKARNDFSSRKARETLFKAMKNYFPHFSLLLLTEKSGISASLRLNYFSETESYLKAYTKKLWKDNNLKELIGNKKYKEIQRINDYIATPNANFHALNEIQTKLLLAIFDSRDLKTGDPFKEDSNGNIVEKVNRHHYEILFISGRHIEFIKFDCSLQALVPLTDSSHMGIRGNPRRWSKYFKEVMEAIINGEPIIPSWWNIGNKRDYKKYLRSLGFIIK
ncbi:MAG: hypothetical protein ACFFG0_37620 [Candidatus Thorarchaeota archaeon]